MWWTQALEIADANGKGTGRWRMTTKSDEGGGGPFGDTSHDHESADAAEACDLCDEYVSSVSGFPSRKQRESARDAREREDYARLKEKFETS